MYEDAIRYQIGGLDGMACAAAVGEVQSRRVGETAFTLGVDGTMEKISQRQGSSPTAHVREAWPGVLSHVGEVS